MYDDTATVVVIVHDSIAKCISIRRVRFTYCEPWRPRLAEAESEAAAIRGFVHRILP